MEKISFTKMNGAGNDFIVINKDLFPGLSFTGKAIKKLCDRRIGIGADGLITITHPDDKYDFIMNYYNSDGSTGSLCGNGARCAVKFAQSSSITKNGFVRFISNGLEYSGNVLGEDKIKVNFNPPAKIKLDMVISADGQSIKASFIDTGSPHVIINIENILRNPADNKLYYNNLNLVPVLSLGKEIRYHSDFAPNGTNVNFIKIINDKVYIRTYERGVEDETLSCGTGATASAISAHLLYNVKTPVSLITQGADILTVDFVTEGQNIRNLSLSGPVKLNYTGEFLYRSFF